MANLDRHIPLMRVRLFLAIAAHPGITRAALDKMFSLPTSEGGTPNLLRHITALRGIEIQGADPVSIPLVTRIPDIADPHGVAYHLTPTGRGLARDMIRALRGYEEAEAFDVPVHRPTEDPARVARKRKKIVKRPPGGNRPTAFAASASRRSELSTTFDFSALIDGVSRTFPVRVVTLEGAPWFVATDVCRVLYKQEAIDRYGATRYLKFLSEDEIRRVPRSTINLTDGGTRILVLSESGLYKLIMRNDKPQAHPFQDWVTREVLPSIRKTG